MGNKSLVALCVCLKFSFSCTVKFKKLCTVYLQLCENKFKNTLCTKCSIVVYKSLHFLSVELKMACKVGH